MNYNMDFIERSDVKALEALISNVDMILIAADNIHNENSPIKDQIDLNPALAYKYLTEKINELSLPEGTDIEQVIPTYTKLTQCIEFYYIYNCLREYRNSLKENI